MLSFNNLWILVKAKCLLRRMLDVVTRHLALARIHMACERGVSLIAVAFLMIVMGALMGAAVKIYNISSQYSRAAETDEKMQDINAHIDAFFSEKGRYPCPAPLNAAPDSAQFGHEASGASLDCEGSAVASGTFRASGEDSQTVRTGAVPTRALGLSDDYAFNGNDRRFVYAVTEAYAVDGKVAEGDLGDITMQDIEGNNATSKAGNVVYALLSPGDDDNGAYDFNGNLIQSCDTSKVSGENCDFSANAVFVNTPAKSHNQSDPFVHQVTYSTGRIVTPCEEKMGEAPGKTAFLVDTSGSMYSSGVCPTTLPNCSRMDVAHWAMRRIVPAVINNNKKTGNEGQTSMTGFVGKSNTSDVQDRLTNIVFDDQTDPNDAGRNDAAIQSDLEARLGGMCPGGMTPLGAHIEALAEELMEDGDMDEPRKITVISDGISNSGVNPVTVAQRLAQKYPNLKVDIVDVVDDPRLRSEADKLSLKSIADNTGGTYFSSSDPDALLESLKISAGVCDDSATPPPPPTDAKLCN